MGLPYRAEQCRSRVSAPHPWPAAPLPQESALTGGPAFTLHELAAALERAEASARVLAARARAGHAGAAEAAAFAAIAEAAPEGLVPAPGAGGTLLARHLDQAALAAAAAGDALPADVREAVAAAAQEARRWAGGARALDPQGVARAVRREVATVRGLAADTMSRSVAWEVLRLGTYLPRAGWVAALLATCARLAARDPQRAAAAWEAAVVVTGADGVLGERGPEGAAAVLLGDHRYPFSVAFSLGQVEGAVFALTRAGAVSEAGLSMARSAVARLQRPNGAGGAPDEVSRWVDEVLDAIGTVAHAALPRGPQAMVTPAAAL